MLFTYEAYGDLLNRLIDNGYSICNYNNWKERAQTVILRHDIDNNLEKAVRLSEYEYKVCGGGATYFTLLTTDFYNVFSKRSREALTAIRENGGIIGLHFDETQYNISGHDELIKYIAYELDILSGIIGEKVDCVSMHRPSKEILDANLKIPGAVNSYSKTYFNDMKYLSDSRRFWREDVDRIVDEKLYKRLHILTHPIWYNSQMELNLHQSLKEEVLKASLDYYDRLDENFRDLESELTRIEIEEILRK
jgi:hypothetical protein